METYLWAAGHAPCTPGHRKAARPCLPQETLLRDFGAPWGLWVAGSGTCEIQKLKKEAAASSWPVRSLLWARRAGLPGHQCVWTGTSPGPGRPHRRWAPFGPCPSLGVGVAYEESWGLSWFLVL